MEGIVLTLGVYEDVRCDRGGLILAHIGLADLHHVKSLQRYCHARPTLEHHLVILILIPAGVQPGLAVLRHKK